MLFSDPSNNAFLRLHKPDKFGDNLSESRYAVTQVNKNKEGLRGFEAGKISHAFRNIYPIFDNDNNYLGCVDLGFSSEYLQNTLDSVHKIHTHFLVDKHMIDSRIWDTEKIDLSYKQSMEHPGYMISIRKDVKHDLKVISKATIQKNQKLIHKKMDSSKEFSLYGISNNSAVVISFIPVFSIKKHDHPAAYIVSYIRNPQISSILKNYRYINITSSILIILIMIQLYNTLSNKDRLEEEVNEKTRKLKEINENLETKIKEEIEKNRRKELQMLEQAKNASMGEMIGNIAHQWRQPLSAITSTASAVKLNNELGLLEAKDINEGMDKVINKAEYLSETINTFRNFLKNDKEVKNYILEELVQRSLQIVEATLKDHHIKLIEDIDYNYKTIFNGVESELSQVIINIVNNAKDIIKEKHIHDSWIKIELLRAQTKVIITIEDNGGGIPEDIKQKIFDPYFTTKHQSQGTGLGLHMSYKIVTESLKGKLNAKNTPNGAKFFIELPISDKL